MEGKTSKLIEALGLEDAEPIIIQDTPEMLKRHEEIAEFIRNLQRAAEITRNHIVGPFKGYTLTNVY